MAEPLNKHHFIVQTCLIDPQYDQGRLLPANFPGDLMYDNMMNAVDLAIELSQEPLYEGLAKDLHRAFTRGISDYEDYQLSGQYRRHDVKVGGHSTPAHYLLHGLMGELWLPYAQSMLDWSEKDPDCAHGYMVDMHNMFECIHPFSDGNGRTGRLLMLWFALKTRQTPPIITYDERWAYYRDIQWYRDCEFSDKYTKWLAEKESKP